MRALAFHISNLRNVFLELKGLQKGDEIEGFEKKIFAGARKPNEEVPANQHRLKLDIVDRIRSELEKYLSLESLKFAFEDYFDQIEVTFKLTMEKLEGVTVGEYIEWVTRLRKLDEVEALPSSLTENLRLECRKWPLRRENLRFNNNVNRWWVKRPKPSQ